MKRTKMDNKGFSLVELIIVIAILAILVAIIGSQVIPYIEKSRVSKDISTLSAVQSSFQTVMADYTSKNDSPAAAVHVNYGALNAGLVAGTGDWDADLEALTKLTGNGGTAESRFNSKAAKDASVPLRLYYNSTTGEIAAHIGNLSVSSIAGSKTDGLFNPIP